MNHPTVRTIGHSTLEPQAFIDLLTGAGVKTLVDVRRFPHSRRHPWFNADAVRKSLFKAGLRYVYLGDELGGFRTARVDSPHTALAGSSFQGYADHMDTTIFLRGYVRLVQEAQQAPTVLMCAEGNPKSCHRRLLADRLTMDGWPVHHLLEAGRAEPHVASPALRRDGDALVYRSTALDDF